MYYYDYLLFSGFDHHAITGFLPLSIDFMRVCSPVSHALWCIGRREARGALRGGGIHGDTTQRLRASKRILYYLFIYVR
jgi:hypothetical protein